MNADEKASNDVMSHILTVDNTTSKKVSAFSLSSIKAKKVLQAEQQNIVTDTTILPVNDFSEAEMRNYWQLYAENLSQRGMKIMESLLLMNEPTLQKFKITLELPNEGSKLDFESEKTPLLRFLYSKLNNHDITIDVVVNETVEKKFAFTPQDKYERLKNINPNLELLKRTFDLDY